MEGLQRAENPTQEYPNLIEIKWKQMEANGDEIRQARCSVSNHDCGAAESGFIGRRRRLGRALYPPRTRASNEALK